MKNTNIIAYSMGFLLTGLSTILATASVSAHAGTLTPEGQLFMKKHPDIVLPPADTTNTSSAYGQSPSDLTTTQGVWNYGSSNTDYSAKLTGYGLFNFISPQNKHSSFNGDIWPAFIFRYKDQFEWDSLLWFFLSSNGSTVTSLSYTYGDWFVSPNITLEGGYFLSPLGKFVRDYYFPWKNKLPSRPVGFDGNEAAPQTDVGIQAKFKIPVFEKVPLGLTMYIANGPEEQIKNHQINYINTGGYGYDQDGHKVYGGRFSVTPISNLELGASAGNGKLGLFNGSTQLDSSRRYYSWGLDATYSINALSLNAEYIQQFAGSANSVKYPESARWSAWYGQAAYRIPRYQHWEMIARYSHYISPVATQSQRQWALGLDYWFAPTILAKLSYEFNSGQRGTDANANRALFQFAYGFA